MIINLSHFEASFLFSLFVSVVMGITGRKTNDERLRYGGYCFGCFVFSLFAIGWVMKLGHG